MILPDYIFMIEHGQKLYFSGDFPGKRFLAGVEWDSLNRIKAAIQLVFHLQ
jgi:hypothetical protein